MFTPRDLVVPVGSKVTWTNKDEEPHKVAEANSAFTSQPLDTDEGFTYEFKTPGKYEYFCGVHPRMLARSFSSKLLLVPPKPPISVGMPNFEHGRNAKSGYSLLFKYTNRVGQS